MLNFAHTNPDRVQGLVLVGSTARWTQSSDYPIGLPQRVLERMPEAWGTARLRDVFFPGVSREEVDDDTYRSFEQLIGTRPAWCSIGLRSGRARPRLCPALAVSAVGVMRHRARARGRG